MLLRKAVRAIWSNKRSYIACVFLISIGIMMFLALNVAGEGLEIAVQNYYRSNRFADVFAKVDAMPANAADALFAHIEGVEVAEARYVFEARVEVPGSDEIITLRLISAVEDPHLNKLIVSGNRLANEKDILVNTTFFTGHGMSVGDPITIFADGRGYTYNVCGTAMSPEYAYITRGAADLLPDETGFGIGYITVESMAHLTKTAGVANEVVFSLMGGYEFDDVKTRIEDALAPYGVRELIGRKDQLSYLFLDLEITGIRSMASALPMIFVLMATVVLYLMMKRVIEQDRTQIGTLKGLGYSNMQVLGHYLSYGGVTGIVGGVFGFFAGYALSGFYLSMFLQFFLLPEITNAIQPKYIAGAFIMSVGGGIAGSFFGAFKTLRLSPSEAMRPENPKPIKYDIVGKMKFLSYILTSRGSMAMRSVARNWMRSVFVVIGVTFSFGLLSISGSFNSLIDKLIMAQFTDILVFDAKIPLIRPVSYDAAVEEAYAIDYVTRAEGLLEIPVTLRNRHIAEGIILTGVERNSVLYRIADTNLRVAYPPPIGGIILSNGIADKLGAAAGDIIAISSPLLDDDIPVAVSRVIEQNLSSGSYMELGAMSAMFGMPKTASSVILNATDLPQLKEYLKGSRNAALVEDKISTLGKYRDMMAMYSSIYLVLQVMSALVAFAIIYNTATISLSERKREYATLRVLGMTVNEVCEIMNFEYWMLTAVAMALGVPFTQVLIQGMNQMMDTSSFSMPSTIPLSAYLTGVGGCCVAVALSNRSAKMRIRKFDMIEVLKERE